MERQQRFATAAATGLLASAGFQTALALGAPFGRASWGGRHRTLPPQLRIGSALSAAVLMLGALVVLRAGGYPISHVSLRASSSATKWLTGAMTLSACGNFASSSRWERFLMGPIALLLALLCVAVTRTAGLEDSSFG